MYLSVQVLIWAIFLYLDFSLKVSTQPTPWNVIPTFDLRQTWAGRGERSCLPYVASAQSGKLSPCFSLGNKATKTVLFFGTAHILERFLNKLESYLFSKSDSLLIFLFPMAMNS